jgi:hypothetical protein
MAVQPGNHPSDIELQLVQPPPAAHIQVNGITSTAALSPLPSFVNISTADTSSSTINTEDMELFMQRVHDPLDTSHLDWIWTGPIPGSRYHNEEQFVSSASLPIIIVTPPTM